MMPRSTSRKAVSTRRAKNGVAPAISGGNVPRMPSDVPVMISVNGIITISRMMNGSARSMLTITPTVAYSCLCSSN